MNTPYDENYRPKKPHHKSPPPPPPPAPSELVFQRYQFREPLNGDAIAPQFKLGSSFFASHGRDMTISGQVQDKLRAAGEILRLPTLDV